MPTAEEVASRTREALAKDENVLLAYLFGSTVKGLRQPISDIDVAVLLKDDRLERQAQLVAKLAKALRMPEDKVDLVDLDHTGLWLNVYKD
ncbi:MAG: nucleotidyltransferase domain-containing protein [Candidatus Bathyarchaeia archaeon]